MITYLALMLTLHSAPKACCINGFGQIVCTPNTGGTNGTIPMTGHVIKSCHIHLRHTKRRK